MYLAKVYANFRLQLYVCICVFAYVLLIVCVFLLRDTCLLRTLSVCSECPSPSSTVCHYGNEII
jgi:hypothetical protein